MLIHLAGPLFSDAERTFNDRLTEKLERLGFDVFLPQRDGVERHKPPYNAMSLDGRVPDEGACVELGIAHAHRNLTGARRLLVGLHTDDRAAFLTSKSNPMLRVPLDFIVGDESGLIRLLEDHPTKGGRDGRTRVTRGGDTDVLDPEQG